MVEYEPGRDQFVVNGQVISPGRARQLRSDLEAALETRDAYQSSDALEDCATNERAIRLLCDPDEEGNPDIPVHVRYAFVDDADVEDATDPIPDDAVDAWVRCYDTHGSLITYEDEVERIFHEASPEFSGFHVEFADADLRDEHL